MKYFVDTEFHEDGKTIDLISIGVVAEDGRELYLVNSEAELHRCNDWVRQHVLPSLPPYGDRAWGARSFIADCLRDFVNDRGEARRAPEFWGYYSDYDWVAICQLYGTMMQLPPFFPKFCRDLKQLSVDVGSPKHPPDPVGEHNALIDARWNRDLHAFLEAHRLRVVRCRRCGQIGHEASGPGEAAGNNCRAAMAAIAALGRAP